MRHVVTLIAGLALLANAVNAQAQTPGGGIGQLSTGTLANICAAKGNEGDNAVAQGYCRGFIIGVGQYHAEITRPGSRRPLFCLPDPAPTLDTAQASFVVWANSNPQYGGEKAVDGLLRWAAASYPCPPAASRRAGQR